MLCELRSWKRLSDPEHAVGGVVDDEVLWQRNLTAVAQTVRTHRPRNHSTVIMPLHGGLGDGAADIGVIGTAVVGFLGSVCIAFCGILACGFVCFGRPNGLFRRVPDEGAAIPVLPPNKQPS